MEENIASDKKVNKPQCIFIASNDLMVLDFLRQSHPLTQIIPPSVNTTLLEASELSNTSLANNGQNHLLISIPIIRNQMDYDKIIDNLHDANEGFISRHYTVIILTPFHLSIYQNDENALLSAVEKNIITKISEVFSA